MINSTLIEGLNEKILQAKVNAINVNPFAFGVHFPIKKVNAFNWKMLTAQRSGKNVAADIVSDNASLQRKRRPIFQSASGDLPKIGISREMKRSEIKEYQVALALAGDPMALALVQYWADDIEFCFTGVQAELEFIAWSLLSNGGKLSFTSANNAAFATEFDLDYQVDSDQKSANTHTWATAATADPIGDIAKGVSAAKAMDINPKFGFLSLDNFYKLASTDQMIKSCASYLQNATGMAQTPDLGAINAMLKKQAWLNGITLNVIDTTITRELADGTTTSGNPFADNVLILSESPILGSTQYDILKDENSLITRAERSHTIVKKYSKVEPLEEITLAEADALPVLDTAYRNFYIKTNAVAW